MSFADAQRRVDAWVSQFVEGYFDPLTNMARLSEEVGELAREVNHRFGQKTKKPGEADGDLGMEMADIIFVLICMANREGIDLDDAFDRMIGKVETRDAERWTRKGETIPTLRAPPPVRPAAPDSSPAGPPRSHPPRLPP